MSMTRFYVFKKILSDMRVERRIAPSVAPTASSEARALASVMSGCLSHTPVYQSQMIL